MPTYKPVGVDTATSRFPTRVENALAQIFTRRVKRGLAKSGGGTLFVGLPSTSFCGLATVAQAANEVRYSNLEIRTPITISNLQFEVTTGPTANGNVSIGIYAADGDNQPTGAPLYASTSIPVAAGFTGVKSVTGLAVTLQPGLYLVSTNCDQALTTRVFIAPGPSLVPGLGAAAIVGRYRASQPYGTPPNTPTPWVDTINNALGAYHMVVAQWSELA